MSLTIRTAGGDVAPRQTWSIVSATGWDAEEGEPRGEIEHLGDFDSLLRALYAWRNIERWRGMLLLLGPDGERIMDKLMEEKNDATRVCGQAG